MDRAQVDDVLSACEKALSGESEVDLAAVGFWRAVGAVKRNPDWVAEFGDRIGRIDRAAFERWALVKVPIPVGVALMLVGTVVGLLLIGLAYGFADFWQGAALLVGTGVLLVTTHGPAHLIVGATQGMRFSHWFVGSLKRPQPGVKVDYATYLPVRPSQRAWMHAAGAIVTKVVPLVGLGAGWAMGAPGWSMALLAIVFVLQILTDVLWSTGASDWKKFKREIGYAKRAAGQR